MFLVKVCFVLPGKRKNHQMPLFGEWSIYKVKIIRKINIEVAVDNFGNHNTSYF